MPGPWNQSISRVARTAQDESCVVAYLTIGCQGWDDVTAHGCPPSFVSNAGL